MTKIEWANETWSPITGCTPISEGCVHCYAKRMATRLRGRFGYPEDDPFRVTVHPEKFKLPLSWKKPRRIFVCSMGDLFHSRVKDDWRVELHKIMCKEERHTFMLLTKRPNAAKLFYDTMHSYFNEVNKCRPNYCTDDTMHSHFNDAGNIWLGVTAENQETADARIPVLLQIPAAVRFVSVEPMLGPVDFRQWLNSYSHHGPPCCVEKDGYHRKSGGSPDLDWVICGSETGPGARPMNLEWARDLRDQCKAAGVPFFFKKATGKLIPDDLMIREFPKGEWP